MMSVFEKNAANKTTPDIKIDVCIKKMDKTALQNYTLYQN